MLSGMISMLQRLPVGNAIRVFFAPAAGATRWRLLRKATDTFSGHDDPGAVVVYDGNDDSVVLDWSGLINGSAVYYRLYSLVSPVWVASATKSATPESSDVDRSTDVLTIVRERIDAGLQAAVARSELKPTSGKIKVLTAPPLYDNTSWPVVTVHVNSDASGERGVGEAIATDVFDADDWNWQTGEGWLSRWSVSIIGWCLNPDERIALRKAIKRIVVGNLSIFDDAGMSMIDLQQQDIEDFERYSAPVYQSVGTLSCIAPTFAASHEMAIREVVDTANPIN